MGVESVMATKIIKAWIDGAIQEIEVEDIVSPEQPLSVEDRLIELEDKPIITDGNILVGNGTDEMEEMTPEEVLSHINGASVTTMTTAEYEELEESNSINANTLYMLSDAKELWNIEVAISEDGLPSLVDATPMQVVDAIDDGTDVCLYATVTTDKIRYYRMNGRGTDSFGDYVDFVHSNSIEVDTITISRNGRNGTIGRFIAPLADDDVVIAPATAEIGQTIIVKAVDEVGKPIEWEAVDNIRYVASATEPSDKNVMWIDTSDNTNDFEQVIIDTTLTQSGWAADAKNTGDAIRNLSTQLSGLIHVGSTEPTNVVDGMIWVDTSETQFSNNEVS
jgi:hypothetical protein